ALPSSIIVRGRVLDKASGKGLPGVRVSYYVLFPNPRAGILSDFEEYGGLSTALTGPDGSFAVAVLPGPGVLAAAAPSVSSYRSALVTRKEVEGLLGERPHRMYSQDILVIHGSGALADARYLLLGQTQYNALALINPKEKDRTLTRDLELLPPLTRQGTVVGPDGKPLAGVTAIGLDGPHTNAFRMTLPSAT